MLRPVRVTPPAGGPIVTLDEIKRHCRVDGTDSDLLLPALVQAATDHLDGWSGILGRCLVSQEWRLDVGEWPACGKVRLPFPDVSSVAIKYSDADNADQTVSSSLYDRFEDERSAVVAFRSGFSAPALQADRPDPVRVTFTAGFGDITAVPQALKVAISLLAAHWFENREAVNIGNITSAVPMGFAQIVEPYRRVGL